MGLLQDDSELEQWVITIGCLAVRATLPVPPRHCRCLGPSPCSCPMQEAGVMPGKAAGSVLKEGVTLCQGWVARADVSAKPSFALGAIVVGRGEEESWDG